MGNRNLAVNQFLDDSRYFFNHVSMAQLVLESDKITERIVAIQNQGEMITIKELKKQLKSISCSLSTLAEQVENAAFVDEEAKINSVTPLIESLSRRELSILDLIAQGLSNRNISERLAIALSTVKGHIQNIFGKLQVQRRTEAVARARELKVIQ